MNEQNRVTRGPERRVETVECSQSRRLTGARRAEDRYFSGPRRLDKPPKNHNDGPSQGGTMRGYLPEYSEDGETWKAVPVGWKDNAQGVAFPVLGGGILLSLGLFSEHQALSLAHWFAAQREGDYSLSARFVQVRIQAYEVRYEMSSRKVSE